MVMPEYMRVRAYLFNLISKADGKDLQIPPENELCRLFNVSRVTVRGAIKGLVKDKFLIPKRGLGTFMNPTQIGEGIKRMPVIGILQGDGRNVSTPFDPGIASCIVDSGMNFEVLFLPDSGSPERLLETVRAGIDAIIWITPAINQEIEKHIEALSDSGLPLLLCDTEGQPLPAGIDCIFGDQESRGRALADYLYPQGHTSLLLVHNHPIQHLPVMLKSGSTHHSYRERMKELCGTAKVPNDALCSLIELKELLRNRKDFLKSFSLVYSFGYLLPFVMDMLGEAGISVPEDVSLLLYGKAAPRFRKTLNPDYVDTETSLEEALFDWLETRVRIPDGKGQFKRKMEMGIVKGGTVKDLNGRIP